MRISTVQALCNEYRRRALAAGDNLAAEAAWHAAADMLADAAKQDRHRDREKFRKHNRRTFRSGHPTTA